MQYRAVAGGSSANVAIVPGVAPEWVRLVRRGSELHSPDHRMLVPKSAILFVEDLTDGSPIAQFMRQDRR